MSGVYELLGKKTISEGINVSLILQSLLHCWLADSDHHDNKKVKSI